MTDIQDDMQIVAPHRKVLENALGKGRDVKESTNELRKLPQEIIVKLNHLVSLGEDDWKDWLASAAKTDAQTASTIDRFRTYYLEVLVGSAKSEIGVFDFQNRVKQVDASPCLLLVSKTIIIRLLFKGGSAEKTLLSSDQDLEDTLKLGSTIIKSVDQTLQEAVEAGVTLTPEMLGEQFGKFLDETEKCLKQVKQVYRQATRRRKKG